RFEPDLDIVGFEQGSHPDAVCNVIPPNDELRIIGIGAGGDALGDQHACTVQVHVSPSTAPGWHGLRFTATEPAFDMRDADGNSVPGALHGGGIYVIRPPERGACTLLRSDVPDPQGVPAGTPFCACLRSADFSLHRCGIRVPGWFELWREFPPSPDPWKWEEAVWTLIPLREGLPELAIDSWSEAGGLWTKPVVFDKGLEPLRPYTVAVPFKSDGSKPLERLQVTLKADGNAWHFEQHWSGVPEE